jgi:SAM-dependent methyltransferase
MVSRAIYTAAELGIADELGAGPKSVAALAGATQSDESTLYRLLRLLASEGIFAEVGPREFALTPVGACLRRDAPNSIHAFVLLLGDASLQGAWSQLTRSVQSGRPTFADVWGDSPFAYYAKHPAVAEIFNRAMTDESRQVSPQVARAYDFSGAGQVVDIGGGVGAQLVMILRQYPRSTGILFEQPSVAEAARAYVASQGDVARRLEVAEGDFFRGVPEGADVYLVKRVLHDWPDDAAVRILESCRRAARPTSKLLIVELVVGHGKQSFPYAERQDLNMQVLFGGCERSVAEYEALLARSHFRLARTLTTDGPHSILEAVPA